MSDLGTLDPPADGEPYPPSAEEEAIDRINRHARVAEERRKAAHSGILFALTNSAGRSRSLKAKEWRPPTDEESRALYIERLAQDNNLDALLAMGSN